MSNWYELKITPEHKKDYVTSGRVLTVFDKRTHAEIIEELTKAGFVTLLRSAFNRDEWRMETRGLISVFAGHLISIEDRVEYNIRFPQGPGERSQR